MAATATERKLLIAGEWVETGDWLEVRSPYSGDVVGRVAKGGAEVAVERDGTSVLFGELGAISEKLGADLRSG